MRRKTVGLGDDLYDHVLATYLREDDILRRLREETAGLEWGRMQIAPDQGQFMAMLVKMLGARHALEVGVFTGYSSVCVARALPEDGKLITCDVDEEWTGIAQRYWSEAGIAERIDLRIAPAVETLDGLIDEGRAANFDFAFIDADKGNYDAYYERCLTLVRPGGVIAVDNVLWGGSVIDPQDTDPATEAIRALNAKIGRDDRVQAMLLAIGDGVTLAIKNETGP